MKKLLSAILVAASFFSFAATSQAKDLVNTAGASGVALSGYDAVAFFTMKKPVNGDPSISAEHKGGTYFFSSKENQAAFKKDPSKYAPQCGGYCAYGASVNALFPVDISTWQVKDGKLYLNLNGDILKAFNKDLDGNIEKADKNWPGLVKKHG